jgi:hypothetical protein
LRLDGKQLYDRSVIDGVQRTEAGAIALARGVLIEDDGPAAGYSYQSNEEMLAERIWIKKVLHIERSHANAATLLVGRNAGRAAEPLSATINGHAAMLESAGKAGQHWEQYRFDPALLGHGRNDFVLRGSGKVWIARDDEFAAGSRIRTRHPNRSAKSSDGGQSWDYNHLGPKGDIDGEYYVRLFLDQYRASGRLILPLVDLTNLDARPIGPAADAPGSAHVSLDAQTPEGSTISVRYRTGTSPVPNFAGWSQWNVLPSRGGAISDPQGRYLQLMIELGSSDGLATPHLTSLEITVPAAKNADWTAAVRQAETRNPRVIRSSIPFEYEPFDRPELKELREKFALDEVTKNASTEFELIAALARWSSGLWSNGHLSQIYPDWNALKILTAHDDGQPVGGFCQQYNLVFLQACESYGLVGRAVSLGQGESPETISRGGHEVVEIWSNEFNKWVYVDGNCAWYLIDEASGTPLSLWELRERQLAVLQGRTSSSVRLVRLADTRFAWEGLTHWPPFA